MIDWLQSSVEERRALYGALKNAADRRNMGVTALTAEITAQALGADYDKTLRAGRYSRKTAGVLAEWLSQHETKRYAQALNEISRSKDEEKDLTWRAFSDRFRESDACRIILRKHSELPIVRPSTQRAQLNLSLHEEFYIAINAAEDGHAIAFQNFSSRWYPLPLAGYRPVAKINAGQSSIPINPENGKIDYLAEDEHVGYHEIVVITALSPTLFDGLPVAIPGREIPSMVLDEMAIVLSGANISAHLMRFYVSRSTPGR